MSKPALDSITDIGKIVPAAIGHFPGIGRFMLSARFFQELRSRFIVVRRSSSRLLLPIRNQRASLNHPR
jgi:hypothetical protein